MQETGRQTCRRRRSFVHDWVTFDEPDDRGLRKDDDERDASSEQSSLPSEAGGNGLYGLRNTLHDIEALECGVVGNSDCEVEGLPSLVDPPPLPSLGPPLPPGPVHTGSSSDHLGLQHLYIIEDARVLRCVPTIHYHRIGAGGFAMCGTRLSNPTKLFHRPDTPWSVPCPRSLCDLS